MSSFPFQTLKLLNLKYEISSRILFQKINLTINSGDIICVHGENGVGKTTFLRILAGILPGYSGKVFCDNKQTRYNLYEYHKNILFLGHKTGIKPVLTPLENLSVLTGLQSYEPEAKVLEALEYAGLIGLEYIPCNQLSAGQCQRVALARLFLSTSSIWILDEPFTSVDVNGISLFFQQAITHTKHGGIVILTAHHDLPDNTHILKHFNLADYVPCQSNYL